MIINHNLSAINANRNLGVSQTYTGKTMEKLSSGMRINRAADDAAGLAISEKMRSQIRGLNQAQRNVQDGISMIQTTEGYLQETQDILHRIRELSVQSSNGTYADEDRMQIQVEVSQLVDEVNRIASHAQFNGMNLLTGRFAASGPVEMRFQVGANMDQSEMINIRTMTAEALGVTEQSVVLSSMAGANSAIGVVDDALKLVNQQRADLGAFQNRFEEAAKGIAVAAENLQAAESQVRDADMANQVVDFTRNTILNQTGTAMLAQANLQNQGVLQLLS